jgi:hypothetical protein
MPKVEMPAEQRQSLKKHVEDFRKAVEEGKVTEPLVLTSEDLNALIEEDPDLKGKVYMKIDGDELKGQVSIPLEKIGLPVFRGRYLNGEADFKASLENGILIVTLDGLEVNGKSLPPEMMTKLREQNLAKDAYNNPKNAEMLRKVESMEIKDGKIIIKVRAKSGEATGKQAEKEPPPKASTADSDKKASPTPDPNPSSKPESKPADSPVPKR